MAEASRTQPGGMLAIVGLDEQRVEAIRRQASARGRLFTANRNSAVEIVLSGEVPAVEEAQRLAVEAGARRAPIVHLPLAAHPPLMEAAGGAVRAGLGRLAGAVPKFPSLGTA